MAYALQIACITLLAEVLFRTIPVASAGFRYAYWRLVLAGALLMPWLMRLVVPAAAPAAADLAVTTMPLMGGIDVSATAAAWTRPGTSWVALLPWIYAAGIAARVLWVAAGIARLRALRRAGTAIADPECDHLQRTLRTNAELRAVADIAQPVTFGIVRPVVLLPASLAGASASTRRAVVTHELVHVQRRDWLWVIGEELLRAAAWFHPAIWWLTSRIRLTREEFTDHLAVLASGSRRHYMAALLAFAETAPLDPAPAFARRAHLFHRIVLLSKESAMSSRRIVLSGVVIALLLVTGSWYAGEAFPVRPMLASGTPPAQQATAAAVQVNPITPENPIPRRVFSTPVYYPPELAGTGYESAVEMRVVLDANGAVALATRGAVAVSAGRAGPDSEEQRRAMDTFVAAAADAIRQWQYDPPAQAPIAFYVGVTFKPGAAASVSQSERGIGVTAGPNGVRLGASGIGAASARRVQEAVTVSPRGAAAGRPAPLRVGGAVGAPVQTKRVNPVYPEIARAAGVQGVVILEATIDETGLVTDVRVLRSIPLLDQAAIDAVRQWEYSPTLLNGVAVPIIMTTTVSFRGDQ